MKKARERELFAARRALANAQRLLSLLVWREGGRVRIDARELDSVPAGGHFRARVDKEQGCMVLEMVETEPEAEEPSEEVEAG